MFTLGFIFTCILSIFYGVTIGAMFIFYVIEWYVALPLAIIGGILIPYIGAKLD